MEISMENSEAINVGVSLLNDRSMQSYSSFKGSETFGNDSASYETFLLEDFDSYMDDINVRLTISRMVSDSVIKGIVNAVLEETAEKIALKEAEVAFLSEKLCFYRSTACKDREFGLPLSINEPQIMQCEFQPVCTKEYLGNLKKAAQEQFHSLEKEIEDMKDCRLVSRINLDDKREGYVAGKWVTVDRSIHSLKNILRSVYEQVDKVVLFQKELLYEEQWEKEFQEEIDGIVFRSYIRGLQEDFQEKLREQRNHLLGIQIKNRTAKVDELTSLCEELDVISRSVFGPEPGKLLSHGSQESVEEWTSTEKKDWIHQKVSINISPHSSFRDENGTAASKESKESPEKIDSVHLMHMSKEDLINYFKAEMTKMKRNHESTVQEMTEGYFSLKREFLKERGSSHGRKDKEFDTLRKKISEIILKLDALVGREKLPMFSDKYENICTLKERVDNLVLENLHLRDMLADKRKEVKFLASQVSDAADKMSHHSLTEANFLKRINKLKSEMGDVQIETVIQEEIYNTVLQELIGEKQCDIDDADIEAILVHEMCAIIFGEAVKDADAILNLIVAQYNEEKQQIIQLKKILLEKEKASHLEIQEKEKLKQEIVSLTTLVEEKEKLSLEMRSALMKQEEKFDLAGQELSKVKDQVNQQERLISEKNKETDLLKGRLKEALGQIGLYEAEVEKLGQTQKVALDEWKELERQKNMLNDIIQEKQSTILAAMANDQLQMKQMECITISVKELSNALFGFEHRTDENLVQNSARLEMLNSRCCLLVQQANLLTRKGLLYKQRLERRCADLQMAEAEVDLLGDEVDALLSLLEKIYIALDHYSPVLQHYTGIMEILELIRRELKGDRNKPICSALM